MSGISSSASHNASTASARRRGRPRKGPSNVTRSLAPNVELRPSASIVQSITQNIRTSGRPQRQAERRITNVGALGNIDAPASIRSLSMPLGVNDYIPMDGVGVDDNVDGSQSEEEVAWSDAEERSFASVDSNMDNWKPDTTPMTRYTVKKEPNMSSLASQTECLNLMYLSSTEVEGVDENDTYSDMWIPAKVEELRSQVLEHNTWEVVSLTSDRKAITARWVLKQKFVPKPRLKARFTLRGFLQRHGLDYGETYAPVAKLVTLRIFLSIVAILRLHTFQQDLKTAFLNAHLEEEVYCKPTKDMVKILSALLDSLTVDWQQARVAGQIKGLQQGKVLRMKKACYGLKQAPRAWWKMFEAFLKELGFVPSLTDPCLYVLNTSSGGFVLLLLYVDDVLIASNIKDLGSEIARKISNRFRVSTEGSIENYLGIEIDLQVEQQKCFLTMSKYMEKLLKRFKMEPKPSVDSPLQENYQSTIFEGPIADETFLKDFEYRSKVGSILYYMICVAPQLAFAVGLVARYCERPTRAACAAVTRIIHYAYNVRNMPLVLGGREVLLTGFSDSDLGGCRVTRKSTCGYCIYLGYGLVDWCSRLQNSVASNVFEAEYMVMSDLSKAILAIRWLLYQTNVPKLITKLSSNIFCDNMAAMRLGNSEVGTKKSKHIAIRYHVVRELVSAGVVSIEHVSTEDNVADIFTKALGRMKYHKFADCLMGYNPFQEPAHRVETIESPTGEYV